MNESEPTAGQAEPDLEEGGAAHSLFEDVETLIDDGRVALAAEFQYQKARLTYSGKVGVKLAVYAVAALLLAHCVLVALTVGLLLALTPLVTALGATAIVAGGYLLAMLVSLWLALRSWRKIRSAFAEPGK